MMTVSEGKEVYIGVRIWPAFPSTQDLIERAVAAAPRCLAPDQRERAFLSPEPPLWCIEREKWPYQSQDWKDWLRFKRSHADPPLPTTPEWKSWRAADEGR
jgi:hypothetical protein